MASSQPYTVAVNGGLVSSSNVIDLLKTPGVAKDLRNFEVSTEGGYRRINGFAKHITPIVPQTSVTSEKVSMVAFFNNKIMAARGEKIFTSAQTETCPTQGR